MVLISNRFHILLLNIWHVCVYLDVQHMCTYMTCGYVLSTSVVGLTGRAAQDVLFNHVAAQHLLLKAFGPLLQEPLSCHHLQLPANTQSTSYCTLSLSKHKVHSCSSISDQLFMSFMGGIGIKPPLLNDSEEEHTSNPNV